VSSDAQRDCYELEIKDMFRIGDDNLVRVYVLENTSFIDDKRFMRIAERRMSGGDVRFSNGDFK